MATANRKAEALQIEELKRLSWRITFDEQAIPDLKSEAIDFRAASELFAPYRQLTTQAWSTLRVTTEHQGLQVPTIGGLLLFGKDRFARFPDAWIQAGRFAGIHRARLLDSAEIRSFRPRAAEEAIAFIHKHLTRESIIEGVRRLRNVKRFERLKRKTLIIDGIFALPGAIFNGEMDRQQRAGDVSRRTFLGGAAALAAPFAANAVGPNDRISVGMIGLGIRGSLLLERLFASNKETTTVSAVCDAYTGNLAKAGARIQTLGGNTPKHYADYRDLLQDKSIDAVFIATPEHLHCTMLLDALKAGKHAYTEKPLAHTIEEGEKILKAAENSRQIVQVGTQNRSNSLYAKAKEMIAAGMIGEVNYTRAFWYRNSLDDSPAWRYPIPADASEQNTDWNRFLGSAPKRPFNKARYFQWRLYWDYSGGISTDLLVHQTDITQYVLGQPAPASCTASGAILRWKNDDREVPDTLSAIFEYPGGFHLNYSCYFGNDHYGFGEQFMGTEGTIEVLNRQTLNFYPEKLGGKAPAQVAARKELSLSLPGNDGKAVEAHITNFFESLRGREKVIAPLDAGQRAAISGHLATLSFRQNRKMRWDERTRTHRAT